MVEKILNLKPVNYNLNFFTMNNKLKSFKRIYWGVEFKDDTSNLDKTDALIAVNKYILNSFHALRNYYIFQFNSTIGNPEVLGGLGGMEFGFGGGVENQHEGTRTPPPPPGPIPHYDYISPFIKKIKVISRTQFIDIFRGFQNTSRSGGVEK
jgi:hypothetical protein